MKPLPDQPEAHRMRLDKWLWSARLYKTRALAAEATERGRVEVNGQPAKRAREVHVGDRVELRQGMQGEIAREAAAAARPFAADPAQAIAQGRPTKRDRRELAQWQRWSARIEGEWFESVSTPLDAPRPRCVR